MATKKSPAKKKVATKVVKKAPVKKIAKKVVAKKVVAKKAVKNVVKKPTAKKVAAKKPAAKKAVTKKVVTKKPAAKKVAKKTAPKATTKALKVDQYGLESDDEFYGLYFAKSTKKGLVEVKPCTFSLMYWWKGLLGYPDMIEISKDSNTAMLQFESTFGGGDSGETELTEKDVFDVDHIIEVDEDEMMISLYSYVPIPVPEKLIGALGLSILNINPETRYGSLEICSTENEEGETEHFLRYRAATYLRGIKSGKVEAIESMITNGSEFFGLAIDAMCVNKSIKKWLLS
ncbi:hypothetical protein M2128_000161 [Polynucleobacter sphagniphilus]|jgi:hypothetical protein|uniref:Uncharacterized protein n=1 Tax=Polynucleobacter sphagniphilus TaxID=1743169 RepID=A0AA43S5I1_9BURK|nr:hypothetical protein [Polynucleobacter sphagniphilus]MDH6301259.1 hypothetical protein [Polynucleobacter sphagniphilus]MDH6422131.1 hypothetical protein [Polynucleobacter sphagniphilus]MDH6504370.1 hypothetical protein [Polynucleobacter sphagniphilus]MDH6512072.1 hypothetical protein [Polynucleobacter sphagniphilus]MDH6524460.1 hypothetical protein [Polynucleobacter sphagniphilus]